MNMNRITWIILAAILATQVYTLTRSFDQNKVGYVRTGLFIESFKGTQEVAARIEAKKLDLTNRVDSFSETIQEKINLYEANYASMSLEERQTLVKDIQASRARLTHYTEVEEAKYLKEQETLQNMVFNQANGYLEEYGREHGYEIILGTTEDGSLLFGEEALDITEDLVASVNKMYLNEIN